MIVWKLKILMAARDISNKNLAAKTGLHETTISRLKTKKDLKQINIPALHKICEALDCTPNDLLGYSCDYRWIGGNASNAESSK